MFRCLNCKTNFDKLKQYHNSDKTKMFQVCPYCNSEDILVINNENELKFLREDKLRRICKKRLK